jgi:uncharacterized protein DUF6364
MTCGRTNGSLRGMTAKVTLSFSDQTIADARHWAQREGVSLSAWIDRAARERALREIFSAHAAAVHRAGLNDEETALADEEEYVRVATELRRRAPR